MKVIKILYLFFFLYSVGCVSTQKIEFLMPLPYHQTENTDEFDKSARLAIYTVEEPQIWEARFETLMRKAGYTVLDDSEYCRKDGYNPPDWVIEPFYYVTNTQKYQRDTYLYTRVIITVRKPLRYSEYGNRVSSTLAYLYEGVSRINCGRKQAVSQTEYQKGIEDALTNLLKNKAFLTRIQKETTNVSKEKQNSLTVSIQTPKKSPANEGNTFFEVKPATTKDFGTTFPDSEVTKRLIGKWQGTTDGLMCMEIDNHVRNSSSKSLITQLFKEDGSWSAITEITLFNETGDIVSTSKTENLGSWIFENGILKINGTQTFSYSENGIKKELPTPKNNETTGKVHFFDTKNITIRKTALPSVNGAEMKLWYDDDGNEYTELVNSNPYMKIVSKSTPANLKKQ